MKTINIPYGHSAISVDVPEQAHELSPNNTKPVQSAENLIAQALNCPLGTIPLTELARRKGSAVILIACRTRRTGSERYLPEIVRRLNVAGIPDSRITVITATGTHDNFRPQDAPLLLGEELARRVGFAGHDCDTPHKHEYVGTTSRGTEVWLSKRYLEADLRIATGRVTFHYFAGFSGGRKAILPGVSRKSTVRQNHRLAVQFQPVIALNPQATNGCLNGNPIHEDMLEAARMAPPEFTLNTVLNTAHEITHAFGGDLELAHLQAVRVVEQLDQIHVAQPLDWLILSAGGAPYDVNGIQAIKALINCYRAVRPGGTIIFFAQCPEGIVQWLTDATQIRNPELLRQRIADGTVILGHNALWMERVRNHARVVMLTDLAPDIVERLGFEYAAPADAQRLISGLTTASSRGVVIRFGNIAYVTGD